MTQRLDIIDNELARELLGIRVTSMREENHLTQGQLSAMAGIERTYLLDIEKGRRNVSTATLARIAWCFGISLAYLLEGMDDVDLRQKEPEAH